MIGHLANKYKKPVYVFDFYCYDCHEEVACAACDETDAHVMQCKKMKHPQGIILSSESDPVFLGYQHTSSVGAVKLDHS